MSLKETGILIMTIAGLFWLFVALIMMPNRIPIPEWLVATDFLALVAGVIISLLPDNSKEGSVAGI